MKPVASSLERLRSDFDGAFALPAQGHAKDTVDLLLVSSGSLRVAVLVDGLDAIHRGKTVVRLPSHVQAFKGVCNLGGHLSSVYDLASLLGVAGGAPVNQDESWLLVLKQPSIALRIDALERYLRVPRSSSLVSLAERPLTVDIVLEPDGAVHLLQVPALARAIEGLAMGNERKTGVTH